MRIIALGAGHKVWVAVGAFYQSAAAQHVAKCADGSIPKQKSNRSANNSKNAHDCMARNGFGKPSVSVLLPE